MESKKLCFALEEAEEELRLKLEAMKQEHEIELSRATSEVGISPISHLYYAHNEQQVQAHKQEIGRLHTAMQLAAQAASKEHHSKDKRIHLLEKKVGILLPLRYRFFYSSLHRFNLSETSEPTKLANFPRHSNTSADS